jgi:copper chaperone
VSGMHCESCAALVEESLVGIPGVTGADVDLVVGVARVEFDTSLASTDDLCGAVAAVGYVAAVDAGPQPS